MKVRLKVKTYKRNFRPKVGDIIVDLDYINGVSDDRWSFWVRRQRDWLSLKEYDGDNSSILEDDNDLHGFSEWGKVVGIRPL